MNIATTLERILRREGGWSDHEDDRGGATHYGVTLGTFQAIGAGSTVEDLKALTPEAAKRILLEHYWLKPNYDTLDLDDRVAELLMDTAVHSGAPNATKMLQRACEVTADGIIGPKTMDAVSDMAPQVLASRLLAQRLTHLATMIAMDPTQAAFARGWMARMNSFLLDLPNVPQNFVKENGVLSQYSLDNARPGWLTEG